MKGAKLDLHIYNDDGGIVTKSPKLIVNTITHIFWVPALWGALS